MARGRKAVIVNGKVRTKVKSSSFIYLSKAIRNQLPGNIACVDIEIQNGKLIVTPLNSETMAREIAEPRINALKAELRSAGMTDQQLKKLLTSMI